MTEEHEHEWTPDQKRMHAIGQLVGLQRADFVDSGSRWEEALLEMALVVAISRLGVESLDFDIAEWLDIAQETHGIVKMEIEPGKYSLEAVTRDEVIKRRQAQMVAMMGGGLSE